MQAITLPATLLKWDPNTGARAIIYYHVTKQFLPCLLELIDNIFHSTSRRKFIYCTSTSGFIYNKNSICWWWWWWWWWWIVFVVWLTDGRRLALFPAGIIVRDPHHRESPTHHAMTWCLEDISVWNRRTLLNFCWVSIVSDILIANISWTVAQNL